MKLLSFLISSFFLLSVSKSGAQTTCSNDSTIVTFQFKNSSQTGIEYSYSTRVFDRDSGTIDQKYQRFVGSWDTVMYSTNTYQRIDTVFYPSGWVKEIHVLQNTGGQWEISTSKSFIYNPSGKLLEEHFLSWNGLSFDSVYSKYWQYNPSDQFLSFEHFEKISGVWMKKNRVTATISDGQVLSKVYESGTTGNVWRNDSMFQFQYTGLVRTGAELSFWDTLSTSWVLYGQYGYSTYLGESCINVIRRFPNAFNPSINDTISYHLDTTEAMISYHFIDVTHQSNGDLWAYIYTYESGYHNGILKPMFDRRGQYSTVLPFDSSWAPYDRPLSRWYYYDTNNRLVLIERSGGSTNPSGGFTQYVYDSLSGHLVFQHNNYWTMVIDENTYTYHYYYDSSDVSLLTLPWDSAFIRCPGSTFKPVLIPVGGCPPYNVSWSPSTGLSNDSVLDPEISLTDSIDYTIILTDNAGHADKMHYTVDPLFSVSLSVDSTSCQGSVVLSVPYKAGTYYQWYRDNVAISGADSSSLTAPQGGNYFVSGYRPFFSMPQRSSSCLAYSDTVHIDTSVAVFTSIADAICQGQVYYLPDSTALTASGTYEFHLNTVAGCDSTIELKLHVSPALQAQVTVDSILCHGDSALADLTAISGSPPYTGTGLFYLPAGQHQLIVTDSHGCTDTAALNIPEPPDLFANAGLDDTVCLGQSTQLGAQPAGSGGTGQLTYSWTVSGNNAGTIANPTVSPAATTSYRLEVTDENGCTEADTVDIVVVTIVPPVIQFSLGSLNVDEDYTTYTWYFNGQPIITGSSSLVPAHSGNYQVAVRDSNNCFAISAVYSYISTGLDLVESDGIITMFPNPVSGILQVKSGGSGRVHLTVRDVRTGMITDESSFIHQLELDMSEYSPGVYMIGITDGLRTETRKLIKL